MNTNTLSDTSKQITWINLLKSICTFFIVFHHSITHIWTTISPDTVLWKVIHPLFLLSRLPVLLFFMCSGFTILKKERKISDIFKKNIFQIVKIYFFWMLIYGIKDCFILYSEGLAGFRTCFNALVKSVIFGHYHTWFVFTLISLYLITPFLFLIAKNKRYTQYFLILSVIYTILIPMLQPVEAFNRLVSVLADFNMTFVTGYVLYYMAGYYMAEMNWCRKYTVFSVILFLISFGSACLITALQSIQLGSATFDIFGNFSLLAFLSTLSLFGIFRGLEHISFPPFCTRAVVYGFGIYLMHPLFIDYMKNFTGYSIFIAVPVFYAFCLLICRLLNKSKLLSCLFIK